MKKKKITKASKRRLVVFGTISLIVIGYFVILSCYNYFKITSLNKEYKELQDDLSELKREEKDLKNDINKLQDPDYLARFARENYAYSKDGEIIIKIDKDKEEKKESVKKIDMNKIYYPLIGVLIFVLLLIIFGNIGKKSKPSYN